jgi:hypothetical protein
MRFLANLDDLAEQDHAADAEEESSEHEKLTRLIAWLINAYEGNGTMINATMGRGGIAPSLTGSSPAVCNRRSGVRFPHPAP